MTPCSYNRTALIPARSGSKGLKNKNVLPICGKPMIAYTIEAALESELFKHVYVSTDSTEYAKLAEQYGAKAILRDESISGDSAPTYAVIEDFLSKLSMNPDYFALLQPTSPLRTAQSIVAAATLFESNIDSFDFLVSVKESEFGPDLVKPIENDLSMKHFSADFAHYARQKDRSYSPNGAIYFAKPKEYMTQRHFFGHRSIAYIMSKRESVDIDDEVDFTLAEALLQKE